MGDIKCEMTAQPAREKGRTHTGSGTKWYREESCKKEIKKQGYQWQGSHILGTALALRPVLLTFSGLTSYSKDDFMTADKLAEQLTNCSPHVYGTLRFRDRRYDCFMFVFLPVLYVFWIDSGLILRWVIFFA